MINKKITIINKLGLHARAAAKLVTHAGHYASLIEIKKENKTINAKSIMGVMMLAASRGTELEFQVTGEDEATAMADIENLFNDKFGEAE